MGEVAPAPLRTALHRRYTIRHELGRGGAAFVYLAHDLKHDRSVAIKVLRAEIAVLLGAERFLREIRFAAQLQHPNILSLFDSGEAGGWLYYVMPYVEGHSLRRRLTQEGPLPLDDALRITRDVCSALGCAHSQGVVHRDIKPENILLSGEHAVVADFGLAIAAALATALEAPASIPRRSLRSRRMAALVAGIGLLLGGGWLATRARSADAPLRRRLAVLPLANLMGDSTQNAFVDGLHQGIIDELAKIAAVSAISRASVLRYRDSTRLPFREIARRLG